MIRKTILGLGLCGLLNGSAQATDVVKDTGLSPAEARKAVLDDAIRVNYDTWKKEVVDYDGAVIVLFSSSCPADVNTETTNRNMDIVYIGLMDKFEGVRVNSLPLKFGFYDVCGRSKADLLGVTTTETHMYLDGKEIDKRVGGPANVTSLEGNTKAMSDWVSSNLLNTPVLYKGEQKKVVFNGEYKPQLVAYNQ
ncbi:MAG: hypothetical protein Q8R18_01935 [bacterium]|nr:hypothetical protein [bacterium]